MAPRTEWGSRFCWAACDCSDGSPYDFDLLPKDLLAQICGQLEVDVPLFLNYPQRRPTRQEHIERIRQYLGLRPFIESDRDGVKAFVDGQVRAGERPHELLPRTEQRRRPQHLVLPGLTVLEKLIAAARAEAEEKLFQQIASRVGQEVKERILILGDEALVKLASVHPDWFAAKDLSRLLLVAETLGDKLFSTREDPRVMVEFIHSPEGAGKEEADAA